MGWFEEKLQQVKDDKLAKTKDLNSLSKVRFSRHQDLYIQKRKDAWFLPTMISIGMSLTSCIFVTNIIYKISSLSLLLLVIITQAIHIFMAYRKAYNNLKVYCEIQGSRPTTY